MTTRTTTYEAVRCNERAPADCKAANRRFRSIEAALAAICRVITDTEEWCVVEIPPGEDLDYDGIPVARIQWVRGC